MTNDYTIQGTYTLPSLGKVYGDIQINPDITLRSMTTNEEMRRLNHSDRPYLVMSEIIDDCMVEKCPISVYDMCLADYQFLLHKLRVVTYGPDYKLKSICPYCATESTETINLDDLVVTTFDKDEFDKYNELDLPKTKHHIKLRMQTPRIIDGINIRAKEQKRRTPDINGDPAFLFTLEALIEEIDGEKVNPISLPLFVRNLPMMDTNYIFKYAKKLQDSFGLNTELTFDCKGCGLSYDSSFRATSEFFGPSVDI